MSNDEFEVTWEADDGYCGGSRPHNLIISADDFDDDEDEASLKKLFWEYIQSDFEQRVSPFSDDEEEFISWAKQKIAERKGECHGER